MSLLAAGKTNRRLLLGLVALAVLLRLTLFLELADTPLPRLHQWHETDMAFFHEWGQSIADGDLLTSTPRHPFHGWHAQLAKQHLEAQGTEPTDGAMRQVWNRWYGGPRFHQEPAYPYLLGALFALGGGPGLVYLLQALLGLASLLLLFLVARRLFDEPTALVAAALLACFAPGMFYEWTLLRVSLVLFSGLAALYLVIAALDAGSRRLLAAAGLVLGVAVLVKSTALLFAALVVFGILVRHRGASTGWTQVGWLVLGMVVALLPAIVRNLVLGIGPLQLSSVGPVTFINANAPDYVPGSGFAISRFAEPLMAAHYDSLAGSAVATIELHQSFFAYLGVLLTKAALFFLPNEVPNNANLHYFASFSNVLTMLQYSFWWLALPAVGGVVLALRRWRRQWPLFACLLCALAPMVIFYNLSRFRAPVAPFLAPFAAHALVSLVRDLRTRNWHRPALVVGLAALTATTALALRPDLPTVRTADVVIGNQMWEQQAGEAFHAGHADEALTILERALEAEDDDSIATPAAAQSFGKIHFLAGTLARELGREAAAEAHLSRARELAGQLRD